MPGNDSEVREHQHDRGVARLVGSYALAPDGAPVRLAKSTSNLFRPRSSIAHEGLDVSGLGGVLWVDPEALTAEVQGMCTYETLVAATLPHGLMPLVVPQLRTITLGGAVSGLGIESTSFRNGLPHESVIELDVLTGTGDIVTARSDNEHAALFETFPNSYGSLGYATRLVIELEPIGPRVALRHVRFTCGPELAEAIEHITATRAWAGTRVDGLDGVVFGPNEVYLTLATWSDDLSGATSDYGGGQVYYKSLQTHSTDVLTAHDYLWRWDTDWFWCSAGFGAQNRFVRRMWPRRWRRSDVYHRLVALDHRWDIVNRLDRRAGRPARERVVQDIEVPVARLSEFLSWFDTEIGMRPVWLCPLRLRQGPDGSRRWPTYPLSPGVTYVNVGFWGTVPVGPNASEAPLNRAIEAKVTELGGHKSLYSEAFYDRATFDRLYDGANLAAVKAAYDPAERYTSLYDKAVRRR